ncbi:MAG: ATP-binding protein, partial [Sphingomonadales bacterium]|nr:ATP-binding protein [Sphingomonadales bacterium]
EQPSALFFGRRLDEIGDFHPNLNGEEPIRDALERRVPFREQLIEITSSEAGRLLFHLNGVPSFDKQSGDFVGFRGSGMDVTQKYQQTAQAQEIRRNLESTLYELKHKNTQLDIASVQAESALRAKNEFLAAMSHELRTPLNAIIGFAEAMKLEVFGDLNEKYVTYCADIMDAGRHLLGLINDVLDVAVIESGELTVTIEDASLKSMLEQAVKLLELRAAHKKLDLSACAIKPEQDFLVSVDLRRATQIFLNLLTNAVKFTPEKGAIGIDIDRVSRSHVAATIWDTGMGIPADQLDAVFEKFQQVGDDVYSRKAEGTGLGLHISRELARQMGGDITLESTPGEGSQFTVTLPISSLNDGS